LATKAMIMANITVLFISLIQSVINILCPPSYYMRVEISVPKVPIRVENGRNLVENGFQIGERA
jgi:hypothetical protein